jgi:catechol 2,3-dioxygenase-like lactoylglutathione lyase family enzyme
MKQPFRSCVRFAAALASLCFALGAAAQETGHLHHVHLNVSDIGRTTDFYQRIFGVVPIQYDGRAPALLLERSFLFMTQREAASIGNHQRTGLTHFCWGTRDGQQTYDWLKRQGVEFYTPVEELLPGSTYMYLYGPDREVIELTDFQPHHRYNHVHLVAKDAKQTAEWFRQLIHAERPATSGAFNSENVSIDGVLFSFFPIGARFTPHENDGTLQPTEGTQLDHIAFSFRDLSGAYRRIRRAGVEIVRPLARDPEYGFRHFFVRAPNRVLVELVEARSWPEAAWER